MEHPPKQGLKRIGCNCNRCNCYMVLMEHPPKQGLKLKRRHKNGSNHSRVLMEHPPKQGLKQTTATLCDPGVKSFNGTSTKTRIETLRGGLAFCRPLPVLMEHPPKQGLKLPCVVRRKSVD